MDPAAAIDRVRRIREQKEAWDSAAENARLWESVPAAHQATSEGAAFVWEPVVAAAASTQPSPPRLFPADLEGWEKERRPWDTRQGCFPDCFFCAAVGTLPARAVRRLFLTDESDAGAAGVYAVRLWRGDAWVAVLVDDVVPKTPDKKRLAYFSPAKQAAAASGGGDAGGSTSPLLWPSLLEKAYAAFYGGFARIVGGSVPEALHDMLGDSAAVLRDRRMLLDGYLPWSTLRQKKREQVAEGAFDLCIVAGTPPAAAPAAGAGKKKEVHGFLTPNHAYIVVPHVAAAEEPSGGVGRRGKKAAAAAEVVFELVNPQLDKAARCNGAATLPGSSVPASFVARAEAARPAGLPAGKYVGRAELEGLVDGFFFAPVFRGGGERDGAAAAALRPAGVFPAPLSASLGSAGGGPSYCTFRDNPVFRVAVEGRGGGGGGGGAAPPLGRYFVTVSQEERRGTGSVGARLSYPLLGVTVVSADAGKHKAAAPPPALASGLLVPGRYTRELVALPPADPFPLSFYNTRTASYDVTPCLAAAEAAGRGAAVFVVPSTPDPGADVPSLRVAFHSAPGAPPLRVEPLSEQLAALRGCAVQAKGAFDAAAGPSTFHKATQYSVGFADAETPPPSGSLAVTAVLRQASAPRKGAGSGGGGDTVGAQAVALLAFSGVAGAGEGGGAAVGRVAEDGENATCLTPLPPKLSKQAEVAVELRGLKASAFPLVLVPVVHSGAGGAGAASNSGESADAGYTLSVYCTDAPLAVRKATGAARRPSSGRRLPPSAGASKPKPKAKPNPKGKGTSMSLPVMQKASSSTGGLAGLYSGL
eukprot:Rhum_TRINITY_DN2730_c0_g1::Rhum_TRINITY_DN2730_c0_g1_i1::g.7994::m.7994